MTLFSERYGYVKPSDVLKRECFYQDIANGVCTCLDEMNEILCSTPYSLGYEDLEEHVWVFFMNKRKNDFYTYTGHKIVSAPYFLDKNIPWYKKLDLIEFIVKYLDHRVRKKEIAINLYNSFIAMLNMFFSRHHYAYKIVNNEVVEVTSEEEVKSIETAIDGSHDNIKEHLSNALSLYAKRPDGDYRNSIKESISAVEAYCREKTGENTLGRALKKLETSGVVIPKMLKDTFEKLYAYTNQPDTGIRHALMDEDGEYVPKQEEALFMLVSCCSFLNYLKKKE